MTLVIVDRHECFPSAPEPEPRVPDTHLGQPDLLGSPYEHDLPRRLSFHVHDTITRHRNPASCQ